MPAAVEGVSLTHIGGLKSQRRQELSEIGNLISPVEQWPEKKVHAPLQRWCCSGQQRA